MIKQEIKYHKVEQKKFSQIVEWLVWWFFYWEFKDFLVKIFATSLWRFNSSMRRNLRQIFLCLFLNSWSYLVSLKTVIFNLFRRTMWKFEKENMKENILKFLAIHSLWTTDKYRGQFWWTSKANKYSINESKAFNQLNENISKITCQPIFFCQSLKASMWKFRKSRNLSTRKFPSENAFSRQFIYLSKSIWKATIEMNLE